MSSSESADRRSDVRGYVEVSEGLADVLRPLVDYLKGRRWDPVADGHLLLSRQTAVIRQFELLSAMVGLATSGHGHASPPLLRSSCEELITLTYLHTLDWSDAEQVVASSLVTELANNLAVQREWFVQIGFDPEQTIRGLGITEDVEVDIEAAAKLAETKLATLDQKLGWGRRKGQRLPSSRFMARKVHRLDLYDFIFHSTSRFVHFSAVELYRRSWQDEVGGLSGSSQLADYWAAFALYWGGKLLVETVLLVLMHDFEELPAGIVDVDALDSVGAASSQLVVVPLILPSDLGIWP